MEHTIGVDKARARLGQLADQAAASEPVILTRRGERLAVLIGPADYEQLLSQRRAHARQKLTDRLAAVRESVTEHGLDVAVVDEAIAAARALD
jgi:prevent-host-death family protein